MPKIVGFALRGFLVVFGAIVLALSVTLAKQQERGNPPAETSFFAFAGAFGIIASAIAILAILIEKIPRVGVIAADTLASIFYLAGAIALTIALKPVSSCTSSSSIAQFERFDNKLLNGGCEGSGEEKTCFAGPNAEYTSSRCQKVQADYVFGYIAFVFGVASIVITILNNRRAGTTTATYV
ncbi:marvel domain-containing protein [Nemania sp. NC0429]|nr:marvel domain-containing protein [Nemania sp. NC0429]